MSEHLKGLDGLRGGAAVLVVLSHCSNLHLLDSLPFTFSGAGKIGVWIFFSLSAFLLAKNLFEQKYINDLGDQIPKFFITRFFRIVVPYFIVVLLAYINSKLLGLKFFYWMQLDELYSHFTFQQGKGVFWSVVVEVKFYLMLPIFFLLLGLVKSNAGRIFTIGLVILLMTLETSFNFTKESLLLFDYLPIFLGGVLAFLLYEQHRQFGWILAVPCILLIFITIPGVLEAIFGDKKLAWGLFDNILLYTFLPCFAVYGVASLKNTSMLCRVLSSSLMRFFGKVSFGIYLFHPPIMSYMNKTLSSSLNGVLLTFLIVLSSSVVAYLFFILVEKPSNRLGNKIVNAS